MKRKIKIKCEYCCLSAARKIKTGIINGTVSDETEVYDAMPSPQVGDRISAMEQDLSVVESGYVI